MKPPAEAAIAVALLVDYLALTSRAIRLHALFRLDFSMIL